jgi:hypothetical protein
MGNFDRYNPAEHIDRSSKDNFRQYMLDNPFYAYDILGIVPTEEAIDEYIKQNERLFNIYGRIYNKMSGRYRRRRL